MGCPLGGVGTVGSGGALTGGIPTDGGGVGIVGTPVGEPGIGVGSGAGSGTEDEGFGAGSTAGAGCAGCFGFASGGSPVCGNATPLPVVVVIGRKPFAVGA